MKNKFKDFLHWSFLELNIVPIGLGMIIGSLITGLITKFNVVGYVLISIGILLILTAYISRWIMMYKSIRMID